LHIWMLVNSYRCSTGGSRFSRCAGESHNHQPNEFPRYHELIHTLLKSFEMCRWIIPIDTDAIRVIWISSTHLCTVQEFRLFNFMDSCLHCLRFSKCVVSLCYIMYVHMISVVASDVTVYVRACVRVWESVCVYICVCMCACVCVCVCARVRAFDHNPCLTQETRRQWSSSLYPRRAHSPWHWLCRYMYVAVCFNVYCSVYWSVLQCVAFEAASTTRTFALAMALLVHMCCNVHCSLHCNLHVCCSVLQCVAF